MGITREQQLKNSIQKLLEQRSTMGGEDKRIKRYRAELAKLQRPAPISLEEFKGRLSRRISDFAESLPDNLFVEPYIDTAGKDGWRVVIKPESSSSTPRLNR